MKKAYFYLPCGNKLDSESPNFKGYYDVKQSWNGWKCPKFEEQEFDKIVEYYTNEETNTKEMIEEIIEFCDKKKNKVIIDNKEYYDFGSMVLCWGIIDKEDIHLNKKETLLLKLLTKSPDKTYSYSEIENNVWGADVKSMKN